MAVSTHSIQIVAKRKDAAAVATGLLSHLSDLDDDYMIADPVPDFRDWDVTLADGRRVGRLEDVVIDTSVMRVKYLEVKLDSHVVLADGGRWRLIPTEYARVDEAETRVVIDQLPSGGLAEAPRHRGLLPTEEEERLIQAYFALMPAVRGR